MAKVKTGKNGIVAKVRRITALGFIALLVFMLIACADKSRVETTNDVLPSVTKPSAPDDETQPDNNDENPSLPEIPNDKEPDGETPPPSEGDKEPDKEEPGGDKEPDKEPDKEELEKPEPPQPTEPTKSVFEGSWCGWLVENGKSYEYALEIDSKGKLLPKSVLKTSDKADEETYDLYSVCDAIENSCSLTITFREDGNKNATLIYADNKMEVRGFSGETLSLAKGSVCNKDDMLTRLEGTYFGSDTGENGETFEYALSFARNGDCFSEDGAYEFYSIKIMNGVITVEDSVSEYELVFDYENRVLTFASSPAGESTALVREVIVAPPEKFLGVWKNVKMDGFLVYELTLRADGGFSLFKIIDEERFDVSENYTISYNRNEVLLTGKTISDSSVKLEYNKLSDSFTMQSDFTGEQSHFERA